jgi:hypothetical protein
VTLVSVEPATPLLPKGRQLKFTPERLAQITNLVERGKSREEIAELVGATLGSLQVTCSRLGISLRRRVPKELLPQRKVANGNGAAMHISTPSKDVCSIAILLQYKGKVLTNELPLTQDMIKQLAFEADFRNMRTAELIGKLLAEIAEKDLFKTILDGTST